MRSDFWSLPYAARRAIRRGESAAREVERLSYESARREAELKATRDALLPRLVELQALLESPEQSDRYLARQELGARLPDIIAALGGRGK